MGRRGRRPRRRGLRAEQPRRRWRTRWSAQRRARRRVAPPRRPWPGGGPAGRRRGRVPPPRRASGGREGLRDGHVGLTPHKARAGREVDGNRQGQRRRRAPRPPSPHQKVQRRPPSSAKLFSDHWRPLCFHVGYRPAKSRVESGSARGRNCGSRAADDPTATAGTAAGAAAAGTVRTQFYLSTWECQFQASFDYRGDPKNGLNGPDLPYSGDLGAGRASEVL